MSARTSITDGDVMRRAFISGRWRTDIHGKVSLAILSLILAMTPGTGFAQDANAPAAPPAVPPLPAPVPPAPVTGAGLLPADFSAWGMFLHADIVVKIVMV